MTSSSRNRKVTASGASSMIASTWAFCQRAPRDERDSDLAEIDASRGAGLFSSTRSAEEIVRSFTDGAAELPGRWAATSAARSEYDTGGPATTQHP